MTDLGLIYTSGSLPSYRAALGAMGATWAKIIPAWFPYLPQALAPRVLVRSSWGDPSYDGGRRAYPDPAAVVSELAPWAHIPGVAFEIGNEPNVGQGINVRHYAEELSKAVSAVRAAFAEVRPAIPIVAGSLSMNSDKELRAALPEWLTAMGPALRACDAVAIHAYTPEEAEVAARLVRQHVSASLPLWMTEVNVNAALAPAERARQVRAMTETSAMAALYHWCEVAGADPVHFNPHYTLSMADLAALRAEAERPVLGASVPGFAMDIRRWRTVAEFRAHLARYDYRATAPWARGVTIHHTISPLAKDWRGARSIESMATYYKTQKQPPWSAGPHLFVASGVPDPATAGAWQMTPLNVPGIHAVSFNATHWSIEMVGNFDASPPPPDVTALTCGVAAALLDWAGLPTSAVNGHRDDKTTTKTCPGRKVDISAMRRAIDALRNERL